MEKTMKENLEMGTQKWPYLTGGSIALAAILVLIGSLLTIKGPHFVKGMALASLERNLAPFGIKQIEIETINFGWGRVYLRDIHSKPSPSEPIINIQEMDIALSLLLNVKAIDVIGATLELKEGDAISFSKDDMVDKIVRVGKVISQVKQLKLPTIAMRDCLVIIPSSQGPLKLPVHAITETTVTRNQVLTIDWGEYGENKFSGQLILDSSHKGVTADFQVVNIDILTPTFQLKAPEISLWGTNVSDAGEDYKVEGFAKLERLMLNQYGSLKMPLEVNLEGSGTPDNLVLDEMTIKTSGGEKNRLEIEGAFKPNQASGQMILTTQIAQISKLWDFTPILRTHEGDTVSIGGKVNLTSEIIWDKGQLKTSVLMLEVKGGSLTREGLSIEGANAQILFNKLQPLTTKGDQKVSATKISAAGIDLKNVVLKCLFDSNGFFQIKQFTAQTLQGNLKAHKFLRIVKGSTPAFQFETDFDNIELADILKLTDLKSLSGRGKLAGSASMNYTVDEGLDIAQAELHSISNSGLIQYKPEDGTAEGASFGNKEANMAFQVLDDLNFSVLNVRLEQVPGHPTELQGIVKMLGSNPKVLNGYPFEFNIVTTGKLKDLVINTLQHMRPPTDINELNKAIKATKAAKAMKKAKAAKEAKEVKKDPKPKKAKATEVVNGPKDVVKSRGSKKVLRAKLIKAHTRLKAPKKLKLSIERKQLIKRIGR